MCKTKEYPQEDMFFFWEEVLQDSDSSWRDPTDSGAIGKEPVQETLETQVRSLGREDRLENPMDRGAWWATVHGVPREKHDQSNLAQLLIHWF